MVIPQRGSGVIKRGCGKMGVTPNLLWLDLCCVLLCGGNGRVFIYLFSSPTFPQMLLEFEPATFWSKDLLF